MRPWLETMSGRRYDLLSEDPDFDLDDLIWGCARACRYAGQIRQDVEHYSVAEHSVLVGRWVEERVRETVDLLEGELNDYDRAVIRTAYAHDLLEGVTGDIATPLKAALGEAWRAIETRGDRAIARRYDLLHPFPLLVKWADTRILLDECSQLKHPRDRSDWGLPAGLRPLGVKIEGWPPARAAEEFRAALAHVGIHA